MKWFMSCSLIIGAALATYAFVTPGDQLLIALVGGVLIGWATTIKVMEWI